MAPELSVVVPAWNEAALLKRTLPELYRYLQSLNTTFELIPVNDGSLDATASVMNTFAKQHKNVHVVSYAKNKGKGGALSAGFAVAKGAVQAFIDADLTIDMRVLGKVIAALGKADIAIASKHAKGADVAYPWLRTVSSYGFTLLTRFLFGMRMTDFQCGCKAFTKKVAADIIPQLHTQGFLWDTEFLVKANRKHYKITEVPAIVHPDERRSKVSVVKDTRRMFLGLLRLKRELHEH